MRPARGASPPAAAWRLALLPAAASRGVCTRRERREPLSYDSEVS